MLLDYYVLPSASMPPKKTSAVTRRSTRVAVKKQAASVSVKESAPTTSAVGGRRKATKSVSIVKVGTASRAGKASKNGPRTVNCDHRSSDARSPVRDDLRGQQLAVESSVETSLLEESESLGAEDVDDSPQYRERKSASRAGELVGRRHRSTVGDKDRDRRSRSLSANTDARTLRRREAAASSRSQNGEEYDLAAKSSVPSGRGTSACATGSKSIASCWRPDRDLGHSCRPIAPRGWSVNSREADCRDTASCWREQAHMGHALGSRGCDRGRVRRETTPTRRDRYIIIDDERQYFGEPGYNREVHRTPGGLPNREADYGTTDHPAATFDNLKRATHRRSRSEDHLAWTPERASLPASRQGRGIDSSIEMPRFDGTGDLDIFLQRFQTLADYYLWSENEQLFRLKTCIQGDAQYVLTDLVHEKNVYRYKSQLRDRFQSAAHVERFRSELSRLRRGSMSLEQLHLKVRSLVSKAAPGPWTALTEIYARDAFLVALGDEQLRSRIMMTCSPPETLASVYDLALRAFNVSEGREAQPHDSEASSQHERKPRYARGVAQPSDQSAGTRKQEESEVQHLREENLQMKQKIADVEARLELLVTSKQNRPIPRCCRLH